MSSPGNIGGLELRTISQIVDAFCSKEYQNGKDMIVLINWCEKVENQISLSDGRTAYKMDETPGIHGVEYTTRKLRVIKKIVLTCSGPT